MSDFLVEMARSSRARVPALMPNTQGAPAVRPLLRSGFDLIAEVKLSSPSMGVLQAPTDPVAQVVAQAQAYVSGGAAAISVLTEPDRFGGHLDHLRAVARAVSVPVMRKDFLVDPLQVHEARAAGASGVLLILGMLDVSRLQACLAAARSHRMFILLEAFDAAELRRAEELLGLDVLLGLNCRDLRSLQVDKLRLGALAADFPAGAVRVAESGLETAADAAQVAAWGYDLALVGTSLMQAQDPARATAELLAAGRAQEDRCAFA